MISAQECRDKLQIKREELNSKDSEKVYQEQNEKVDWVLDNWIKYTFTQNRTWIDFDLPPHPKLISELEEAGYVTKVEKHKTFYELELSVSEDAEDTSLQDESSTVEEEPAQKVGFLSKLKSFVKGIFTSSKDTL